MDDIEINTAPFFITTPADYFLLKEGESVTLEFTYRDDDWREDMPDSVAPKFKVESSTEGWSNCPTCDISLVGKEEGAKLGESLPDPETLEARTELIY